ncbi:uncharacterized protein [Triticum aestivum]|uniref:uncharacterized protein n=1 Tax=Triticum aestivum TaxID=4565 RepID=UPI001D02DF90|nr:uncharacterized protein LOC123075091 [Triticum aestivum]
MHHPRLTRMETVADRGGRRDHDCGTGYLPLLLSFRALHGATSYLMVHPEGNIMVDRCRYVCHKLCQLQRLEIPAWVDIGEALLIEWCQPEEMMTQQHGKTMLTGGNVLFLLRGNGILLFFMKWISAILRAFPVTLYLTGLSV